MNAFIGLLVLFLSLGTNAAPTVIADYGGRSTGLTTPQEFFNQQGDTLVEPPPATPPTLQRFPINSAMTPGQVQARVHHQDVLTPLFIIGADHLSLDWLRANADYFRHIHASGMVTNVDSLDSLNHIKSLAPGVSINAMPVEVVAEAFHLTHYPVLIDREGIKQ